MDHAFPLLKEYGFSDCELATYTRGERKITVNAIPSEEDLDHLFWEEWHTRDGQVHHQILTRWQPIRYDGIFHAPPRDEEPPQATAAKRWFVVDDDDMRPVLLCQ